MEHLLILCQEKPFYIVFNKYVTTCSSSVEARTHDVWTTCPRLYPRRYIGWLHIWPGLIHIYVTYIDPLQTPLNPKNCNKNASRHRKKNLPQSRWYCIFPRNVTPNLDFIYIKNMRKGVTQPLAPFWCIETIDSMFAVFLNRAYNSWTNANTTL